MRKNTVFGKKMLTVLLAGAMSMLGCGTKNTIESTESYLVDDGGTDAYHMENEPETGLNDETEVTENAEGESQAEQVEEVPYFSDVCIRIGGMKGPTSMGMVKLLEDASKNESALSYEYTLATAADELTPMLVQGTLDIAAVPSNLAAILYANTDGAIEVLAVNTLGVTYIVDTGDSIQSVADLKGKTIYATGQGAVPDYTLQYILEMNGIDPKTDVTIEFKSEPTEIVALMKTSEEEVIAMLPQPFVTVAATQVEGLRVALNMNEEWDALETGSSLVTGVLVVRKEFAEGNEAVLQAFLQEYAASVSYVNENPAEASAMVEALDIVKAPIAEKAIPNCNMTMVSGQEMKDMLTGFYQVLFEKNSKSVGGAVPGDAFYCIVE